MKNVFDEAVVRDLMSRIDRLKADSQPLWGTMTVAQMLAHCCVTYEMVYETKHTKPGFLMRLFLTLFVKNKVTNETPYPHNLRTAPQFIVKETKDFDAEKKRLTDYIQKTQRLGASYFHHKESLSFGMLPSTAWNNMFYKHLDHHLRQFGV